MRLFPSMPDDEPQRWAFWWGFWVTILEAAAGAATCLAPHFFGVPALEEQAALNAILIWITISITVGATLASLALLRAGTAWFSRLPSTLLTSFGYAFVVIVPTALVTILHIIRPGTWTVSTLIVLALAIPIAIGPDQGWNAARQCRTALPSPPSRA